ncbi:MAG: histidine phosphatase family protein [Oscillospiraceae bacterium]|nr:histidine phosphatase family protein [Oscillospiraceae bacterium]
MKVLLIRHGLTRLGEEHRYQGSLDDGLSERGRAELKRAELSPARVFVSPAKRARETAEILFPQAEQIVCPGLREMDFGMFEGRGWWEMEDDPAYNAWIESECRSRCPQGEDREGFSERVCAAFEEILARGGHGDVLVLVAHGGTQMALLEHCGRPSREYYRWQRPCGCGWELDYDPTEKTLTVEREIAFLK